MADENRLDTPAREGDVLGLSDAAVPQTDADRALAAEAKLDPASETRRRRADDIAEREAATQGTEAGPDDPRGLHVDR